MMCSDAPSTYVVVRGNVAAYPLRGTLTALEPDSGTITVAIIEDNRMVRDGMTTMLNHLGDVDVVFAADSACLERLHQVRPRVLLLNVGLATPDCLSLVRRVRTGAHTCDVVVMNVLPAHGAVAQFVNEGVAGFILKDATFAEFAETIRAVALGDSVLPSCLIGTLFAQLASEAQADPEPARAAEVYLTPREIEVITWIAQGRSNKEIALQLNIAAHTVKTHVRNVMEKLALNTRLQIAAYAHAHLRSARTA